MNVDTPTTTARKQDTLATCGKLSVCAFVTVTTPTRPTIYRSFAAKHTPGPWEIFLCRFSAFKCVLAA